MSSWEPMADAQQYIILTAFGEHKCFMNCMSHSSFKIGFILDDCIHLWGYISALGTLRQAMLNNNVWNVKCIRHIFNLLYFQVIKCVWRRDYPVPKSTCSIVIPCLHSSKFWFKLPPWQLQTELPGDWNFNVRPGTAHSSALFSQYWGHDTSHILYQDGSGKEPQVRSHLTSLSYSVCKCTACRLSQPKLQGLREGESEGLRTCRLLRRHLRSIKHWRWRI